VNTARRRRYECIGGPLCGKKVERMGNAEGFSYTDKDFKTHWYRIIRVAKNDFSAVAKFFHYFGINGKIAKDAHPRLMPPDHLFKKTKRP